MVSQPQPLNVPADPPTTPDGSSPLEPDAAGKLLQSAKTMKVAALANDPFRSSSQFSESLSRLQHQAAAFQTFDPQTMLTDQSTALAFWINLYNAMVIHAALTFGVRRKITDVPHFFKRTRYRISGRLYNLDVIEHGLLRANRGHPLRFGLPQLMPWDPRRKLVIKPFDARIHFALNCGAVSCPPIRSYTAKNIDRELNVAARSFIGGGGVGIDPQTGRVMLSRIFRWYARDFGWTKRRQLAGTLTYMDDPQKLAVTDAARNGIAYADYDWSFA